MARNISDAVREICFSFPESEEQQSYFIPQYFGPRGCLGVELNSGLDRDSIAMRMPNQLD
ncbi:MAG TPA: hypothetical protein DCS89_18700 [Gammaproteobacteria bacterium]|jgi:hypothetical protein|nr:hypothetical protein [Gammaproteobacteria bacterium]HAT29052.1 hypothetical protein [Gammaproteobacteria bacterium]HIF86516.1 hypothetical protein [Gammaproteobacteria bacterium]